MGKRKGTAKKFGTEFREFITKGNVISLAVGVIIGGAFQAVVNSAVNDVFMPVISIFTKNIDFSKGFLDLSRLRDPAMDSYVSAKVALDNGHIVLSYGTLLTAALNFLIIGFVVFCIVKSISSVGDAGKKVRKKKKAAPEKPKPAPATKECPFCCSEIAVKATRCPNCTSELPEEVIEKEEANE
ncbi:MAG: large conductance mechanosensitive channel protein MscL [Oscillospiraceae bacterium]|nr:large conductance mechanosensitive channel protein MscL [Oscillospiraceae bacterium]